MILILFGIFLVSTATNCSKDVIAKELDKKIVDTKFTPIGEDFYLHDSSERQKELAQIIKDKNIVCGFKYTDSSWSHYELRDFKSVFDATAHGFTITHYGVCGACSNFHDFSIYLGKDLTDPARRCSMLGFFSDWLAIKCYESYVGFTHDCAKTWYYDSANTRRHCLLVCLWSSFIGEPNVIDGKINNCIQCDEDMSGPLFKYYAGRNWWNSGIVSELTRDDVEIWKLDHCYY